MSSKRITIADDESVISFLTSASASVLAKLPGLWGGGRELDTDDMDCDEDLEEKQQEIQNCLNGVEEEVDLWQLRDLALSRGGLINSHIRKRAWPKIVAAHQQILLPSTTCQHQALVDVSNSSMQLLIKDVAHSLWAIEDHVNMARQQHELKLSRLRKRKVSFVPELTLAASEESDGPSPIKSIDFANHLSEGDDGTGDGSVGTFSPMSVSTYSVGVKTLPKRTASRNEQKVLFNIVLSVLRTLPEDNPYFEDDRYKYYQGLSDVAALLLINLESPSLTSLVLGQLAQWHMRDAMRSSTTSVETAVHLTFYPLLKKADSALYSHISSCLEIPSFCLPWIQGLFCQQLVDIRVASRLMDVFLVSHAMMPIFFCVAFLVHPTNRSKIMGTNPNMKDLYNVLHALPTKMMQEILEPDVIVDVLEDMIEMALSYISRYPPAEMLSSALLDSSLASVAAKAPTIAMLQTAPDWTKVASAPTDYALLQHARAMRHSGVKDWVSARRTSSANTYPRALTAIGSKRFDTAKRSPMSIAVGVMMLIAAMLFLTSGNVGAPEPTHPVETLMVKPMLPPLKMKRTTRPAKPFPPMNINSGAKSVRNETPSMVATVPGKPPHLYSTAISVVVAATKTTNPAPVNPTTYMYSSAISVVVAATTRASPVIVKPTVPEVVVARRPAFSAPVAPVPHTVAKPKALPFLATLRRNIARAVKGFFARFRRTQREPAVEPP